MKHLLRLRVWLALLAGLAVGCILYTLPLEQPRQTLAGWQASWGLYYSPDSRRLVTVHIATGPDVAVESKGAARLWDAETGELIAELEQERDLLSSVVLSVVFSPDGKQVAASNEKGDIKLWDADTGWPLGSYRMKGFKEWQSAAELAFAADGRLLMREPMGTRMWDVQSGQQALDLATALGKWKSRSYGGSSGVVLASDGKSLRAIRSGTGERIAEFMLPEPELMLHQSILTPDGNVLLARLARPSDPIEGRNMTLFDRGVPYLWSKPDAPAGRFPALDNAQDYVFAPDGSAVAGHFSDAPNRWIDWLLRRGDTLKHSIRILDLATGRETGVVPHGLHACFAPDGRTLAVGCVGGAIELWDYPLHKAWARIVGGAVVAAGIVWLLLGRIRMERRGAAAIAAKARLPLVILGVVVAVGPAVAQPGPLTGKPERVDRFGDALPPHALFRIGTARLHLGEGFRRPD
jgi:WD40 repeat protein